MSDGKEVFDNVVSMDQKRGRPRGDGGLGHDELRDRWLERYPGVVNGLGDWQQYANGYWTPVDELEVKQQIVDVIEGSRDEGVKLTRNLVGSVFDLAKIHTYVPRQRWDADPDVVVCANGTLELSTRTLREHRKEDFATSALPYDYDPEASPDVFLAVLQKALPDAMEFLQEFTGYSLTPDTSLETALWFKGPRGSGKSTVIEGLTAMLGERHGILGLAEIESSPFALAKIPGKTLLTSTEQPASYLKSTHVIDALISGEPLMVDRKYREAERVVPVAKVIWAMNDLPRVANTTSGIFRRVKVLEFPKLEGKAVPEVKEEVKAEGAGILNWALDGLERLQERGGFEFPESVLSATANFEHSNDLPAQFVEEMCELDKEAEITSQYLYEKYREWALDAGHKPVSKNRVGEDWIRLGLEPCWVSRRRGWRGLRYRGFLDAF